MVDDAQFANKAPPPLLSIAVSGGKFRGDEMSVSSVPLGMMNNNNKNILLIYISLFILI